MNGDTAQAWQPAIVATTAAIQTAALETNGAFLTQFVMNNEGPLDSYDMPILTMAKCSMPRPR